MEEASPIDSFIRGRDFWGVPVAPNRILPKINRVWESFGFSHAVIVFSNLSVGVSKKREFPSNAKVRGCRVTQSVWSLSRKNAAGIGRCLQNSIAPKPTKRRADRAAAGENQMEWVRQMNACKAQAEAIAKLERD